jgi:hypothetical protein
MKGGLRMFYGLPSVTAVVMSTVIIGIGTILITWGVKYNPKD